LGSARSNRFGDGRGFARGRRRFGLSPSAFSTRRTVVADAPIPKNLRSASRIFRLPASGSAAFAAMIAARRAPPAGDFGRAVNAGASSPFTPPLR
jgi:hypothetical protein